MANTLMNQQRGKLRDNLRNNSIEKMPHTHTLR